MEDKQSFWDAMDACRPSDVAGDADLEALAKGWQDDDRLRTVWERSQHWDRQITSSFQDESVPLPAGLEDRILAALEQSATDQPAISNVGESSPRQTQVGEHESTSSLSPTAANNGRRTLLRLAGLAVAASLVAAFVLWGRGPKPLSEEQLVEFVVNWSNDSDPQWLAEGQLPERYGMPSNVVARGQGRWRQVGANPLDPEAVAVDLSSRNDGSTVLYLVRTDRPIALSSIGPQPLNSTGGVSVAAWQVDGLTYVIVHRGSQTQLRSFTLQKAIT